MLDLADVLRHSARMSLSGERGRFDFNNLFVLEMANNHQGSVKHGLAIIDACARVVQKHSVRAALKFQFRDLDTFIHPADRKKSDNKHVGRFMSTRLTQKDFKVLLDATREAGILTMATPSDEQSVDMLVDLDVDILKISSASAHDWPLLEKAVATGKPMIVSVGGLTLSEIDRLVSFLDHRYANFSIMHCVSIYPTPANKLDLKQIEVLRKSYPNVTIGFSTHEDPDTTAAIQIAYAKGARVFERHVGVPTKEIVLNAYSSNPQQLDRWIGAWEEARKMEGTGDRAIDPKELADLALQKRGVFAAKPLKKGAKLKSSDVYFAFPIRYGQLPSGMFREGMVIADRDYKKDEAIAEVARDRTPTIRDLVYHPIHEVKAMLHIAGVSLPDSFTLTLRHPYGLERFRESGAVVFTCMEQPYHMHIMVQLPHQEYPVHYKAASERALYVLFGTLELELEGHRKTLRAGDVLTIQRGVRHRFWSETGAIVQEISTVGHEDRVYADHAIKRLTSDAQATVMNNWGRHHFD